MEKEKWLKYLESERLKDQKELQNQKKKLANEFSKLKKEDIFPKPKKLTLWKKIKIILLGQ